MSSYSAAVPFDLRNEPQIQTIELPYTEIEKLHELPYTKIVKSGTIGLAFDPNKNLLLFISSELAQKKKTKLFLYFEQKLKVETNYPSKTINMFLNLF